MAPINKSGIDFQADQANSEKFPFLGKEGVKTVNRSHPDAKNEAMTQNIEADSTGTVKHVVKRGETLSQIAKDYNVPGGYQTLIKLNNLRNGNSIKKDQVLVIFDSQQQSSNNNSTERNTNTRTQPVSGWNQISTNEYSNFDFMANIDHSKSIPLGPGRNQIKTNELNIPLSKQPHQLGNIHGLELTSLNRDTTEKSGNKNSGSNRSRPKRWNQNDYPMSPYVTKEYYLKMKEKMGNTPYANWSIHDKKINKLYIAAMNQNKSLNKDGKYVPSSTTIASSGCGIVAFASVKGWNPIEAAEYGMINGSRKWGGLNREFYEKNGGTKTPNATTGLKEVKNGKYLIACMHSLKNTYWTTGSHFILVWNCDRSNVYVCDSSGRDRKQAPIKTFTDAFNDGYVF